MTGGRGGFGSHVANNGLSLRLADNSAINLTNYNDRSGEISAK